MNDAQTQAFNDGYKNGMFKNIKNINNINGMRAALREADMLGLYVRYNPTTFNLDCFVKGVVVESFKAN